jgi:UDP-N-acetylglucosamine--N-acetylmuramyl-(pentapeptide) pyrophosphoryl-undecaprenol N-acetylglucosamine transferase
VLVLGGSQASAAINGLVAGCLPALQATCFLVHQAGEGGAAAPRGSRYYPAVFIGAELPDVMAAADLVVSRAGANTLAELAVLGRPSVLVPLTGKASRGDQLRNAELFRKAGASLVIPEEQATPELLARTVGELLVDRARLASMRAAALSLADARPAAAIAELIRERLG